MNGPNFYFKMIIMGCMLSMNYHVKFSLLVGPISFLPISMNIM